MMNRCVRHHAVVFVVVFAAGIHIAIETGKITAGNFDANAVARQKWNPKPPHVDPDGYFASADTIFELASRIKNPYQKQSMSGAVLQGTVERYNSFVVAGADADFKKPKPLYKIEKPPFFAAWSTPILHDTLTGLRSSSLLLLQPVGLALGLRGCLFELCSLRLGSSLLGFGFLESRIDWTVWILCERACRNDRAQQQGDDKTGRTDQSDNKKSKEGVAPA